MCALTRFSQRGMQWLAEERIAAPVRNILIPHLENLESAGATEIKRSLSRAVYRLDLENETVFVKHHVARSLVERLKYLVLPSRAAAEWSAARALAERGLPVARALAVGERRMAGVFCEAVLVTEAVEDATALEEALGPAPGLLEEAAELIRRMHQAEVDHRDLHGGNLLVSGAGLVFIDLHRLRLAGPVSRRRRIDSLGRFLASLGSRVTPERRADFVRAYLGPTASDEEMEALAGAVEAAAAERRERRYVSRTKRCVKKSTGFRRECRAGMKLYRRADFSAERALEAVEQHRRGAEDAVLKEDARATVSVVETGGEEEPRRLCVKEFVRLGLRQRLGDRLRGTKARRAWIGSNACRVRGIGTPTALAIAEAGPRSFFINEFVEGAERFNDYVADRCRPADADAVRRWRRFICAAADFVRRLHGQRLYHRDLSAKNLLVRERYDGWEFFLLDLSDIRRGRWPSLSEKIRNLGQLDQIYVKPSRTDRLRFYRHYARGRPEFDRREFLAEIDATSRARHENWLRHGGRAVLDERRRQGRPL
jgi:tRNA A-37 threonylcarbamoyl transferase component Bud32